MEEDKNNKVQPRVQPKETQEEDMSSYKANALSVVTFKIVRNAADLADHHNMKHQFHPDMAHQIFGDNENIYGYRHLSIDLFYLHNSAKCCVQVQWQHQIQKSNTSADDIMEELNSWLPSHYKSDLGSFADEDLTKEVHDKMHGNVINSFQDKEGGSYKITECDLNDEDFKEFHARFETFIVWFIDGANFIDLDDQRWMIFYVYEEYKDEETNKMHCSPVGFCSVYKFFHYPSTSRLRISQFFIIPSHQRKGVATQFYKLLFKYLKSLPDIADVTVEEPTPIFQQIRDYCDSLMVFQDIKENKLDILSKHKKVIDKYMTDHKIGSRQAQRVADILGYVEAKNKGFRDYEKFTMSLKARITSEIEKENRGGKRRCNMERAGIVTEPIDMKAAADEAYSRYVMSLEGPAYRLKKEIMQCN